MTAFVFLREQKLDSCLSHGALHTSDWIRDGLPEENKPVSTMWKLCAPTDKLLFLVSKGQRLVLNFKMTGPLVMLS